MSSLKKAILINPEYFSLKKKKHTTPRQNTSISQKSNVSQSKGKQHKKALLKRLKEIQQQQSKDSQNEEPAPVIQNNLQESMDFLTNLTKEQTSKQPTILDTPVKMDVQDNNEPPYTNLKYGSNKPSFRDWKKKMDSTTSSTSSILDKVKEPSPREDKLSNLRKEFQQTPIQINKPKKSHKFKSKTVKITETFGKRNKKVSVYVKSKQDKDIIEQERKTLKKHTIPKIKTYLKSHNLLKTGTYAPNDVLREIYESAYLSGDIHNDNTEVLVHNFLTN